MKMIVAVDNNWGIGKNGKLLVTIPEDMKLFREETYGKVVVMGRKTMDSLKDRSPLEGRTNIVLTRNEEYAPKDAIVCYDIDEVMYEIKDYNTDDVYVIGGEEIYNQFIDYCDTIYVTKIDYKYDADAHFKDISKDENWKLVAESEEKTYFNVIYQFLRYERVTNK